MSYLLEGAKRAGSEKTGAGIEVAVWGGCCPC
jgi:hypothetical protein